MGYYWVLFLSSFTPVIPLPPTNQPLSLRRGFNYNISRPDP